jgi:hypothetical protein
MIDLVAGFCVGHFLSILLLATALMLTVCFGVAAWRVSDGNDPDITGRIPYSAYGWKPMSTN